MSDVEPPWSTPSVSDPMHVSTATQDRILIADDEADVIHLLRLNFEKAGFTVDSANDGTAALTSARQHPSLIILDVMMPGLTGLELLRILKADPDTADIPVILLTARAGEQERIRGLELGADDYVTKPFSPRELVLRVRSILRHANVRGPGKSKRSGDIAFDEDQHLIVVRGRPVDLTMVEFKILRELLENAGRVQTREQLIEKIWGQDTEIDQRTIDTHVRRLREKLGTAAEQIQTVRGFGYRLDEV